MSFWTGTGKALKAAKDFNDAVIRFTTQLNGITEDVGELQGESKDLIRENAKLTAQVSSLEKTVDASRRELTSLQNQYNELKQVLTRIEAHFQTAVLHEAKLIVDRASARPAGSQSNGNEVLPQISGHFSSPRVNAQANPTSSASDPA